MVKNHSDSKKGNPLPPHRLLFPINSKGSFISTIPQTGLHIPRPLLHQSWSTGWNEKYLNVSTMKDRSDDPSHHEQTLLPRSYIWHYRSRSERWSAVRTLCCTGRLAKRTTWRGRLITVWGKLLLVQEFSRPDLGLSRVHPVLTHPKAVNSGFLWQAISIESSDIPTTRPKTGYSV